MTEKLFQNNRVEDNIIAPIVVAFITTFILNLVYEWFIKKYIEVDRELLLIKKREQANFIAKCQNIGLFFGQVNLKKSKLWSENDYNHFIFLVNQEYEDLKLLKQDVVKVFNFRDQENGDNLFFQKYFSYYIGYLIGRMGGFKKYIELKNEIGINLMLTEFDEKKYSENFQLFDTYFAFRFSYNGIFLDNLRKIFYKTFLLKKVKIDVENLIKDISR